jgi:CO/xanthine dehydrogenase FAD-binding subunit
MADVLLPTTVAELVEARAADPDALLLAGGTDLMVAVNAGWTSPRSVIALRRVEEMRGVRIEGDEVVVGATTTYRDLLDPEQVERLPALAQAARTVGSPQIRAAGTLGGNIGTASPAGDTLPVLIAAGASIELAGPDGRRTLPAAEVFVGVKRTAIAPDEVVTAIRLPRATGAQSYKKVGVRNAMVIAVASVAVVVDTAHRRVGVGLGSVGPVPLPAPEASVFAADAIDWETGRLHEPGSGERFGELVASASSPIDDHRSTAAYRRHAVAVMAARTLREVSL